MAGAGNDKGGRQKERPAQLIPFHSGEIIYKFPRNEREICRHTYGVWARLSERESHMVLHSTGTDQSKPTIYKKNLLKESNLDGLYLLLQLSFVCKT